MGIYASENASTAAVEYRSGGIGEFEMVVFEAKTANVTLIDFDYTVNYLGQLLAPMPVASRVMAVPTYSAWKYQPFPLVSQLIGNWIRIHAAKADGMFFRSTKDPTGVNYLLFEPSDWTIAQR